jgi:hypothetical protein
MPQTVEAQIQSLAFSIAFYVTALTALRPAQAEQPLADPCSLCLCLRPAQPRRGIVAARADRTTPRLAGGGCFPHPRIRLSPLLQSSSAEVLEAVRRLGLEGVVGKRIGSTYEPGERSGAWIKCRANIEHAAWANRPASQMCLSFAAPGESNRAHSFASKHRATVLVQHSGKSLAAFYPQPEIPDGLTLSEEVESDGRVEESRPTQRHPLHHRKWLRGI